MRNIDNKSVNQREAYCFVFGKCALGDVELNDDGGAKDVHDECMLGSIAELPGRSLALRFS